MGRPNSRAELCAWVLGLMGAFFLLFGGAVLLWDIPVGGAGPDWAFLPIGAALLVAGGGYFIGSFSHLFFSELPQGGKDYLIPNMLNMANLPTILIGVVLVLLISASVSTLSSICLTACSTLSMDLVKNRIRPQTEDKKVARLTRLFCLVFVVLSYVVANTDTPILELMSYSWGILSGSFLAPYALALYFKRINRAGAWTGMLGGFIIAALPVVAKLVFNGWQAPFGLGPMMNQGPLFACVAMAVSALLCFVGSAVASRLGRAQDASFFYHKAKS